MVLARGFFQGLMADIREGSLNRYCCSSWGSGAKSKKGRPGFVWWENCCSRGSVIKGFAAMLVGGGCLLVLGLGV